MKRLSLLLVILASFSAVNALGLWKLHPSMWTDAKEIAETPRFVYWSNPVAEKTESAKSMLFRFDKETDEVISLGPGNHLSSMIVDAWAYCPELKAVAVADAAHDIHILRDNGETEVVHALKFSDTDIDKTVNSISFDNSSGNLLLSTNFGLVSVNPSRLEIAESRNYNTSFKGITRAGGKLIAISGNSLLISDNGKFPSSMSGFSVVDGISSPKQALSFGDGAVVSCVSGTYKIIFQTIEPKIIPLSQSQASGLQRTPGGVAFVSDGVLNIIDGNGNTESIPLPEDATCAASFDGTEIWYADKALSLNSAKVKNGAADFYSGKSGIRPNAPATFTASAMQWHPELGVVVCNPGHDPNFTSTAIQSKLRVSSYSDGIWTDLSPIHNFPENEEPLSNPNGFAIDPDNSNLLYFTSILNGLERIDITGENPRLHFSRHSDPFCHLPGFREIVADLSGNTSPQPDLGGSWAASCPFAPPAFDSKGNLWTAFADLDNQKERSIHLFCWNATDRKGATVESARLPVRVIVKEGAPSNREIVVPLRTRGNENIILHTRRSWDGEITVIDTNGTPSETSDDKAVTLSSFTDQYGTAFDVLEIRCLWEDPSTGLVWAGHRQGVFRFNPARILTGQLQVERMKVSRSDGTGLADFLLDEVPVNNIAADSSCRKWFATSGAGLIATTSDGRNVVESHTTRNSPIPSDVVFSLAFNPDSGSVMLATASGIAEYTPPGQTAGSSGNSVKAYPNPVKPDWSGYVTIEGLPDNAVVKITDAKGNLVKELAPASGGIALWDVTGRNFNRVGSGVYHILCSGGNSVSDFTARGKILVIN